MKPLAAFFLLAGLCVGQQAQAQGTRTLLFFDKSASYDTSGCTEELRKIVQSGLVKKGDRLSVYAIHANTIAGGFGEVLCEDQMTVEEPRKTGLSAGDKMTQAREYESTKRKIWDGAIERCRTAYVQKATRKKLAQYTDVWGVLQIISNQYEQGAGTKRVYFFCDMYEDMQGKDRRQFTKHAPKNRQEAEAWAEQDKAIIEQQMKLNPAAIRGVKYAVKLGKSGVQNANSQYVTFYWEKLFDLLGMTRGE